MIALAIIAVLCGTAVSIVKMVMNQNERIARIKYGSAGSDLDSDSEQKPLDVRNVREGYEN